MSKLKVGICGLGRIGRIVFRNLLEKPDVEVVAFNITKDAATIAHLIKYDSVHGIFPGQVEVEGDHLIVNGKQIALYVERDIANIPWARHDVDVVIEATGKFKTRELLNKHIGAGAKKVILTAPAKSASDVDATIVCGVNEEMITPELQLVSNASCTTNCLAPMTKVINDTFGIRQALMSTIHSATAKQKAVDSRAGRDWRTGRSVLGNIIPSSTGAAKAVGQVIPELKGKMTGMSFRVPTNDVSVVDLTARLIHPASYHDVCVAMRNAAKNSMKGIITCTTDQVVSSDLTGFSETCIFDETAGIMLDDDFVKLIAWYDNEWGYTSKLLDLMAHIYEVDHQ